MPTSPPTLHDKLPLIEVRDAHILTQVLADPIASACIVARISDCVAAVMPGRVDALHERLRKLGHLPRMRAGQ